VGAQIAVAEACRNVVCSGGEPLAVTNNLNFGNPYVPEVYWHFVEAVKGMGEACRRFETPVTGGNVSFYNQSSDDGPVFPTPTIGMLGLMEKPDNRMTLNFRRPETGSPAHSIYLIGSPQNDIASSEYLYSYRGVKASPAPAFDIDQELMLQSVIKQLITKKLITSAHDISDGGLFVAVAESAMAGNTGFTLKTDPDYRKDAYLFGESQSRVVVSVTADQQAAFDAFIEHAGVAYSRIGEVTAADFVVDGQPVLTTAEATDLYNNALGKIMA
jgi:phosphoribosylformylglycinamidine synthase